MSNTLSGTGVWSQALRYGDPEAAAEAAGELDELGYSALWVPDVGGDLFAALANLMEATSRATIATGILNIWMHSAAESTEKFEELTGLHGNRLILGLGISHALLIEGGGIGKYDRPLQRMNRYLDELDAAAPQVPKDRRLLAALGPRMLQLSGRRAGGAHTYLVTPEHTAAAREALGVGPLLAPEQAVILETDPQTARSIARENLAGYLILPNYSNNWKRLGFDESDLADGGSDRLIDALVAWGDEEVVRTRVQEHRDAGADHVCIQVLGSDMASFHLEDLRRLAPVLID